MPNDERQTDPSSLDDHLSSIVEQRLAQLGRAWGDARRSREVEAVHDLRVASRRLRAFGVTFRDLLDGDVRRRLEKALKRVARSVGALRDLDVQLELLEARLAATSKELDRAALEHLLEQLGARRTEAARRAGRRLGKLDVDAVARRVRRALTGVTLGLSKRDPGPYALSVLEGLVASAAEPSDDGPEDPELLHRLRIDVKELRYALELFEPVLGSHYDALYARAAALQELLGRYNDLSTLGDLLGEQSSELRQRRRDTLAQALDDVAEALALERAAVLERFRVQGFDSDAWQDGLRQASDATESG